MDRRGSIAALLGKKSKQVGSGRAETPQRQASGEGLGEYTGAWGNAQAAHLLRRCMYGCTPAQIEQAVQWGMAGTVQRLLQTQALPTPPLNFDYDADIYVPIGQTWVDKPYMADFSNKNYRVRSLAAWTLANLLEEGVSIREKMTLFWHNHFAIEFSVVDDPRYIYKYITLLRTNALGNFKQLAKDVTIDPTMLRYLNGNQNSKEAPNQNYARELLELFTVGKGPLVAPGDYQNYTEDDVLAISEILTGWVDRGFHTINPNQAIETLFVPNRHSTGSKQLSHRFGNAVVAQAGAEEYKTLIDLVFQQRETARFICRKLYRWFVYHEIGEGEEANVIEPMAQLLVDNNYEIGPVLSALLQSEHFYHSDNLGCIIKNPLDYICDVLKKMGIALPTDVARRYEFCQLVSGALSPLQMVYYAPPSVSGWKAYYQAPQFYQIWINSTTLKYRTDIANLMAFVGFKVGNVNYIINVLDFAKQVDDPFDPNKLIESFGYILFPKGVTQGQVAYLKGFLIPGLPDFEWTVEYSDYTSDPNNDDKAKAVETRLRLLISRMLTMPEFQLS
jgi:uncharacterized protein (DUF1800 family)